MAGGGSRTLAKKLTLEGSHRWSRRVEIVAWSNAASSLLLMVLVVRKPSRCPVVQRFSAVSRRDPTVPEPQCGDCTERGSSSRSATMRGQLQVSMPMGRALVLTSCSFSNTLDCECGETGTLNTPVHAFSLLIPAQTVQRFTPPTLSLAICELHVLAVCCPRALSLVRGGLCPGTQPCRAAGREEGGAQVEEVALWVAEILDCGPGSALASERGRAGEARAQGCAGSKLTLLGKHRSPMFSLGRNAAIGRRPPTSPTCPRAAARVVRRFYKGKRLCPGTLIRET